MRVYLDNAATTPMHDEVVEVMAECMKQQYGNPSSIHAEGRSSRAIIEQARKKIAQFIGASIGEIFFTSGGTESNNMALKCAVRDLGVKRIISSPLEHHCILHTLDYLQAFQQVEILLLEVDGNGQLNYKQLEKALADQSKKTLVSLMHSNNEIGTINDLDRIAALCQANGAFFHSDTVQTMGYYPIDVNKTPIHFLTGSAHKFHGPKGVGFIYINGDVQIKPFIDGGAQERNMRGGTENLYGIVGMAKAMEMAIERMNDNKIYIQSIKNHMMEELDKHFENIEFNGLTGDGSHYKVLSVSFPATDKSPLLLFNLDIAGISASGGSACSSGAEQGSHVLEALALDPARKTIRFSFSCKNTKREINYVVERMKEMVPLKADAANTLSTSS